MLFGAATDYHGEAAGFPPDTPFEGRGRKSPVRRFFYETIFLYHRHTGSQCGVAVACFGAESGSDTHSEETIGGHTESVPAANAH